MGKDYSKAKHGGQACQYHAKERKQNKDPSLLNSHLRKILITCIGSLQV